MGIENSQHKKKNQYNREPKLNEPRPQRFAGAYSLIHHRTEIENSYAAKGMSTPRGGRVTGRWKSSNLIPARWHINIVRVLPKVIDASCPPGSRNQPNRRPQSFPGLETGISILTSRPIDRPIMYTQPRQPAMRQHRPSCFSSRIGKHACRFCGSGSRSASVAPQRRRYDSGNLWTRNRERPH